MSLLFRRVGLGLLAVVTVLLTTPDAAWAKRLALVLGNSRYQDAPVLGNPANDAQDLAKALRDLGFEVIEQHDAGRNDMAKAVHDFTDRLPGADLALFFYAGHGLQINGENYLLPVDANIRTPTDVRFGTIALSDIQGEMEAAGRVSVIILDACRDNPFTTLTQGGRGVASRGLRRTETAAQGSLIVYSTQPNNIALDGTGRNSPFTAALLKNVATPGLEVRQMVSRVRGDVLAATDQKQTPWDSSSLVGDVFLAGVTAPSPTSPPPASVPVAQAPAPSRDALAASPENDCDRYAALRLPGTSAGTSAQATDSDWRRIVVSCQAEVQAHPEARRYAYQLARAQDRAKNYAEALRGYKAVADAGFPEAMNDLASLYFYGHGVVQNYATAFDYTNKAASAGSIRALANLAVFYGEGRGVPKDDAKSLDLAERAVESGNPFGLKIIADHYFNGAGVPRDYTMAAQYLQQAADLGNGQAMKFLANMYEAGYLGPPDPAKAAELRLRAQKVDPYSADATPLRPLHQTPVPQAARPATPRRRYVTYSYNPAWQAAPGDASCCPNNMLVCPAGRHFCGH